MVNEGRRNRRGGNGNAESRRESDRVEALLARSPTYRRETNPGFVTTSPRMRDSAVSETVRDQSRGRSMKKGGVVKGDGYVMRGKTKGKNY